MSRTFELTDIGTSVLKADFYPPIELNPTRRYGLGLLGFYGCHSIHNITEKNNLIGFRVKDEQNSEMFQPITIQIPPGAYEIEEINDSIKKLLQWKLYSNFDSLHKDNLFTLRANLNTLKCEIFSKIDFDFTIENSIGPILGFDKGLYMAEATYESTNPVDITTFRLIRLDCNIISGSYINGSEAHTLFTFDLDVEPGFRLTKEPNTVVYLPITESRTSIDNVTVRVLGDKGELIDFGPGEAITVILELKEIN